MTDNENMRRSVQPAGRGRKTRVFFQKVGSMQIRIQDGKPTEVENTHCGDVTGEKPCMNCIHNVRVTDKWKELDWRERNPHEKKCDGVHPRIFSGILFGDTQPDASIFFAMEAIPKCFRPIRSEFIPDFLIERLESIEERYGKVGLVYAAILLHRIGVRPILSHQTVENLAYKMEPARHLLALEERVS